MPRYLTERDEPWLGALLEEYARHLGKRKDELRQRLREPGLFGAPRTKLRVAAHVLEALTGSRVAARVPPREARWLVFREAARAPDACPPFSRAAARSHVLDAVAAKLSVAPAELESALFADLEGERRVAELPSDLSPTRLAVHANRAIVSSLLRRATHVRIEARGGVGHLIDQARRAGLICVVTPASSGRLDGEPASSAWLDGASLHVSGPFALFRRTEAYARALVALWPHAAACARFELEADCALGPGQLAVRFVVRSGDPIGGGSALAAGADAVAVRFARDVRRSAPDWDVVPKPAPVAAGGALFVPDFALVPRRSLERPWYVEMLGFWTPAHVTRKLAELRAAGVEQVVLCVDERRCCDDASDVDDARVVRYRSRIDPERVLAAIAVARAQRRSTASSHG